MWPNEWPAIPRAIATATYGADAAARAGSADQFSAAIAELSALPFEQVAAVQFRVVRELMETLHPDGLDGDDVSEVLGRCARAAAPWWQGLDVEFLAVVITGALGVAEAEETPRGRDNRVVIESAVLVIADLAGAAKVATKDYIARAVSDIARAETIEMP
ncbi:hypothetical protein [Antrihabitans spumae]|jgi:hypothetical protein|uniref:MftR C-terminal domain-containing protein n=1 Tax=Antrihabitans spumae TaxID=3373370 RepID=A0ABW7JZ13_9NOCA